MRRVLFAVLTVLLALGCSEPETPAVDAGSDGGPDAPDAPPFDAGPVIGEAYGAPGPSSVSSTRIEFLDRTGTRTLVTELWYPADEAARAEADAGHPLEDFDLGTAHEAELASLVLSSPASCIRTPVHSARDAAAVTTPALLPVVVFSHCNGCVRFDVAEVAERLASHGIVVAAPDHPDDTIYDPAPAEITTAFVEVRASDISSVLDVLLDPSAPSMPADLVGRIDPARAAVMGHSYGAATTGEVIENDPRFVAALAIAAPVRLIGAVDAAALDVPYLFLLAQEDNSVGAAGNTLIRADYAAIPGPAWLVEVDAAGHWSFADIAGLGGRFIAGCSALDDRFAYIDNAEAREIAADVAMGFFAHTLLGDPDGAAFLASGFRTGPAHVSSRP